MYDLLLKNAWVVDPLNSVNGVADVAIQEGKIAKVQRDIQEEAKEVIDLPVNYFSQASSTVTFTSERCGAPHSVRECLQ